MRYSNLHLKITDFSITNIHCLIWFFEKEERLTDFDAYKVVNYMDQIFNEEKKIRDAKLTISQVKEKRQSETYRTLINDLESYIDALHPEKGSSLDKAITYYKKMNGKQWTYLNDRHLTLDNNEAKRQAKKFVIDCINFLFSKSEKGAVASCILLTMIDLAYVNDFEPRAYLDLVLNHINKQPPENLLPWSRYTKETIKLINQYLLLTCTLVRTGVCEFAHRCLKRHAKMR